VKHCRNAGSGVEQASSWGQRKGFVIEPERAHKGSQKQTLHRHKKTSYLTGIPGTGPRKAWINHNLKKGERMLKKGARSLKEKERMGANPELAGGWSKRGQ